MRGGRSRRGFNGWRLAGRVVGGLTAGWWVVIVAASAIGGPDPKVEADATAESVGIVVLVLANTGAFVLALFRERFGSRALVGAGVLFCLFALVTAGRHQVFAMLVSGAPFVLGGALLWIADRRDACHEPAPGAQEDR